MMSQGALSSTALSNFAHSLADHAPLIAHACSKRIVFKDNIDSPGGTTVYPTTTARYRSFLLVALITACLTELECRHPLPHSGPEIKIHSKIL